MNVGLLTVRVSIELAIHDFNWRGIGRPRRLA